MGQQNNSMNGVHDPNKRMQSYKNGRYSPILTLMRGVIRLKKPMLKEIENPRQVQGESQRRWFEDSESDLIIWEDGGGDISGFQLCYGKGNDERALTWKREVGFIHERVDDGENRTFQYKSTPILTPDGNFDVVAVTNDFRKRSNEIDSNVTSFVLDRLAEYSEEGGGV